MFWPKKGKIVFSHLKLDPIFEISKICQKYTFLKLDFWRIILFFFVDFIRDRQTWVLKLWSFKGQWGPQLAHLYKNPCWLLSPSSSFSFLYCNETKEDFFFFLSSLSSCMLMKPSSKWRTNSTNLLPIFQASKGYCFWGISAGLSLFSKLFFLYRASQG